MSSNKRILAIALSAVLVLSVLGSGLAFAGTAAAMTNHDDGEEDDTFDGNETDDGNETVDDGNETDDGDHEPFGHMVTNFVHGLIDGSEDTNDTNTTNVSDVPLGQMIANFVVENNPGNAPDHAGPKNDTGQPDHAGPDGDKGKPADAGNETGQPDDAGPNEDRKGGGNDNGGGPPDHAGNDD